MSFLLFFSLCSATFLFCTAFDEKEPKNLIFGIFFGILIVITCLNMAKLMEFRISPEYKQYEIRVTQEKIEKAQEKLQSLKQEQGE